MTTARYRLADDVRFRVIGGEAVVLRLQEGRVLGLNPTGTRILELVEAERSYREIVAILAAESDGDPERPEPALESDVSSFLEALLKRGIVEVAG